MRPALVRPRALVTTDVRLATLPPRPRFPASTEFSNLEPSEKKVCRERSKFRDWRARVNSDVLTFTAREAVECSVILVG